MSVFEKRGYAVGQVVNKTVELLGPEKSGPAERAACRCTVCGDGYVAQYTQLDRGQAHRCSPWKKYGYAVGQVVNGTVELRGPDRTGVGERASCRCRACGEEYVASYSQIRQGHAHLCSPWTRYGYSAGQIINGTVELLGPVMAAREERVACLCKVCGDEYVTQHSRLRRGQTHRCSPWKKHGYAAGDVINGTVELLGPERTSRQERVSCRCQVCGDEYVAEHGQLRKGKAHRCSPWKRDGYAVGQVMNGTIELLGPERTSRQERVSCRCKSCGDEYIATYFQLLAGNAHLCSPWKKYGYEEGQVVNGTVELLGPDKTGGTECLSCRCITCGEEYTAGYARIRSGSQHQCVNHRCILGLANDSYRVVSKSWCPERSAPLFDLEASDGEVIRGLTYAEVRTDYIPDEAAVVCLEAYSSASNAVYAGTYSPWLDAIGTSVDDLRRRLPMSEKRPGIHIGHILPRAWASRFNSVALGLLLNHHANLAWQDGVENMSLNANPWTDCPRVDDETRGLFVEIAVELRKCGADDEAAVVDGMACKT